MEADFWHARWNKNEIGFHEQNGNALLKRFFNELKLTEGDCVFVPLCGKARDIPWLLIHKVNVIGIELNESAVVQLFQEMNIVPEVLKLAPFTLYKAENIRIYVGDFFKLTAENVGNVDAIFDRGALVALPTDMRQRYSETLQAIAPQATNLTISFSYPQEQFNGPPFSVTKDGIVKHYQQRYFIKTLYHSLVTEPFRGFENVFESAYLLTPKPSVT